MRHFADTVRAARLRPAHADLAAIDPMYQYSLPWFTRLVLASLEQAARPGGVQERLEAVQSHFTASLYRNICRCGAWSLAVAKRARHACTAASLAKHQHFG